MCVTVVGPTDGQISVAYVLPLRFQEGQLKHMTLFKFLFTLQLYRLPWGILFSV